MFKHFKFPAIKVAIFFILTSVSSSSVNDCKARVMIEPGTMVTVLDSKGERKLPDESEGGASIWCFTECDTYTMYAMSGTTRTISRLDFLTGESVYYTTQNDKEHFYVCDLSSTPSSTPSLSPITPPSSEPSLRPTSNPSLSPLTPPSSIPSLGPSSEPSKTPFTPPSSEPSLRPNATPSHSPFTPPSPSPSFLPSTRPSQNPIAKPSSKPSLRPSTNPTLSPLTPPSEKPSLRPSASPTQTPLTPPSSTPSFRPTSSAAPSQCQDEPHWHVIQPPMDCSVFANEFECNLFETYTGFGKGPREACCTCGGGRHLLPEPSGLPSSAPSTWPSSRPTNAWTHKPSSSNVPSQVPTSAPSDCLDDTEWVVTTASNDEIKCAHLSNPGICKTVDALGSHNGKVVSEACCVCGGSQYTLVAPSSVPSTSLAPSDMPTNRPSECFDEPDWMTGEPGPLPCSAFTKDSKWCGMYVSRIGKDGKNVNEACCACGGGQHMDVAPSAVPTVYPSVSLIPSVEPTRKPSSVPSLKPIATPSMSPFGSPSMTPSVLPTKRPSLRPSLAPSISPTSAPSTRPSYWPSNVPTVVPTSAPSALPTSTPSSAPSSSPIVAPSSKPSGQPSRLPSLSPSSSPLTTPSAAPSLSLNPFAAPSSAPSSCIDEPNWHLDSFSCTDITLPDLMCYSLATFDPFEGKTATMACCSCGGGMHITTQPSDLPSDDPGAAPSALPSALPTASPTQVG